jgi:uncharacterized protein
MLELRPNCEACDRDLPPESPEAWICSYECTFCADCVEELLQNVCPNCGGGFMPRPVRPKKAWREGVCLSDDPPSTERRRLKFSREDIAAFVKKVRATPPEKR